VPIATHDITGVVLCGGEGRRMGGVEKPLLPLHGRPLVDHVLERLAPQVGRVIISANRELDAYREFGHDVIHDVEPGLGPLGGLASVAPHVSTPWLFCCPGDAPLVDRAIVARLADAVDVRCNAVYPHDGERPQYLFLLVRTAACSSLSSYLRDGARSVHRWLETIEARTVTLPDMAASFTNVNDRQELKHLNAERFH
jgi:molybdenum cofactor guanylyltransferase